MSDTEPTDFSIPESTSFAFPGVTTPLFPEPATTNHQETQTVIQPTGGMIPSSESFGAEIFCTMRHGGMDHESS